MPPLTARTEHLEGPRREPPRLRIVRPDEATQGVVTRTREQVQNTQLPYLGQMRGELVNRELTTEGMRLGNGQLFGDEGVALDQHRWEIQEQLAHGYELVKDRFHVAAGHEGQLEFVVQPGNMHSADHHIANTDPAHLVESFSSLFATDGTTKKFANAVRQGEFAHAIDEHARAQSPDENLQSAVTLELTGRTADMKRGSPHELNHVLDGLGVHIERPTLRHALHSAIQHAQQNPETYKGPRTKVFFTQACVDFNSLQAKREFQLGDLPLIVESTVGGKIKLYTGQTPNGAAVVKHMLVSQPLHTYAETTAADQLLH